MLYKMLKEGRKEKMFRLILIRNIYYQSQENVALCLKQFLFGELPG